MKEKDMKKKDTLKQLPKKLHKELPKEKLHKDTLLEAALTYQARGWSIFPIVPLAKTPIINWKPCQRKAASEEQIKKWWKDFPFSSIGLATGKISNLIVLDVDGEEGAKYIKDRGIPPTPCVKTKKGYHYYFKHPGFSVQNFAKKKGLDLRGDGGYVILPTSKHPSGIKYEWTISPEKEDLADPPAWLLQLITEKKEGKRLPETELSRLLNGVKVGERHDTALRLAGHQIGKGLPSSEVIKILKLWNKGNEKPLPENELDRMVTDFTKDRKLQKKKKPSKKEFNPRPYSNEILREYSLKADKYKRFFIYDNDNGIWRGEAELLLNSILRKRILGTDDYKRYCVGEILADLKGLTYQKEPPEEPEKHLIPFNNKIYDLNDDKLLDYSPDYFFTNKLAVTLNEKKRKCKTIDTEVFGKIVPAKDIISLYEMIAYCLWRGYPYPKMFFLYGRGRNGKGVFTKILQRLLGKENCSLTDSTALQNDKFAASNLYGKLANISGEMEYSTLKRTSKIKQLTGEDYINCEEKFKHPFPFVNYAKMIFLTNQVPLTADRTIAFYARIFLLEFPNIFIAGKNANPMIVENLIEEEIEGLAWRCLDILKGLRERDFVFTNDEGIEETTKKYEDLSNPLSKFLEENIEREPNSDIPVGEFNEKYNSYQKEKGFRVWNNIEIGKGMREKGYGQKSLNETLENGARHTYRAWIEVKWR